MKRADNRFRLCAALLLAISGAGVATGQDKPGAGMTSTIPGAQSDIHLVSPVADGQWTMPAGDYGNTRYSPLDQINTTNVHNLHVVGEISTGIPHGHEGNPLVAGSALYIVTPYPDKLIAVDLTKPDFPVKWTFNPNPDIRAVGVACCDVVNRGATYADGKIIYATLDDHVVGVDAQTGKLGWETQVGNVRFGETIWELVAYIKSMGTPDEPDPPTEPADEEVPNPEQFDSSAPGTPIFIVPGDSTNKGASGTAQDISSGKGRGSNGSSK